MYSSTVSPKYQIVIPKGIRQHLHIKPGQRVSIRQTKKGILEVSTKSALDKYYGSVNDGWGKNPVQVIRKARDTWEDHQHKLDNLPQ